jgi:hypothetical protein
MRTGISLTVSPVDRRRLQALARDRNSSQKHVWRAEIVLLTADGLGIHEVMRQTGKSKTCVWRWQDLANLRGPAKGKRPALRVTFFNAESAKVWG